MPRFADGPLAGLLLTAAFFAMPVSAPAQNDLRYDFDVHADFRQAANRNSDDDCIPVTVQVKQGRHLLRRLSWREQDNMLDLRADGRLEQQQSRWRWHVPANGGRLSYCVRLNQRRGNRYDARVTSDWALFRADDLFPPAASLGLRGSYSRTRLRFSLPSNWTSATPYPEISDHRYTIDNPQRRFDRPTGWIQLGDLGVRRDRLAETQVAVSAPVNQGVQRLEILTTLAFTMPTIRDWFPAFPDRLLVVSATEDMWRGALSGPDSLFLHGERPLISENGTSTLLHELVHVAMQRHAAVDADWIDEGLAEYLSLVMLHESGGLTNRRFRNALARQKRWGNSANALAKRNSSGAATAKAVAVFADLHQEIGDDNFRELVMELADDGPAITPELLRRLAERAYGKPVKNLP